MPPPGQKKPNSQRDSDRKAKEDIKLNGPKPVEKPLTPAQKKLQDEEIMRAKQAASNAKNA